MQYIKGNQNLIIPQNLLTNGDFSINQRGNTSTTSIECFPNDYLCDCWFLRSSASLAGGRPDTINYVTWEAGKLTLSGIGFEGQTFGIRNVDRPSSCLDISKEYPLIYSFFTCVFKGYVGSNSVPLKIMGYPWYGATNYSTGDIYQNIGTTGKDQPFSYVNNIGTRGNITTSASFNITLLESGPFSITLTEAAVLPGAYKNPSSYLPIHPAENMLRCQRYYQSLHLLALMPFYVDSTAVASATLTVVKMGGSPTMSTVIQTSPAFTNQTNGVWVNQINGTYTLTPYYYTTVTSENKGVVMVVFRSNNTVAAGYNTISLNAIISLTVHVA